MAALASSYQVFISFRGSDIRKGFLSHMQRELLRNGVTVYVDETMERGKDISTALKEAIEASQISLVIFSQRYATSTWCLEELVKIMECNEIHQQTVIPVFYNIDPSHVKKQLGTYSDAFAKHEENYFENTTEKLQSWRSALTKTAKLSGFTFLSDNQNESKFIERIVNCIGKKLAEKNSMKSGDSKLLDGIYKKIAEVGSRMKIEPEIKLGSREKGKDGNSKQGQNGFARMKVKLSSVGNWTSRPKNVGHD